jgi:hypothetical protein
MLALGLAVVINENFLDSSIATVQIASRLWRLLRFDEPAIGILDQAAQEETGGASPAPRAADAAMATAGSR